MDPTPYLYKYKYNIRKRGNHLDIYHKKTAMYWDNITQQFYIYDLFYGFEDDAVEDQGTGYDDNDWIMVSEMLHKNKRRIHSTRDSICHLPREIWTMMNNDKNRLWMDLREAGRIRYTSSDINIISGANKDQYGGILRYSIKPQKIRP